MRFTEKGGSMAISKLAGKTYYCVPMQGHLGRCTWSPEDERSIRTRNVLFFVDGISRSKQHYTCFCFRFGGKGFNTQETQHYICVCICDLSVNTVLQERTEEDGVFHICGQDKSCH